MHIIRVLMMRSIKITDEKIYPKNIIVFTHFGNLNNLSGGQ